MLRQADRGDDLVVADRRRQVVHEQVGGGDLALAALAPDDHRALGGEQDRRHVGGRVAVGERAADRAAVAHLLVGDRAPPPADGEAEAAGRSPRRGGASSRRSSPPPLSLDAGQPRRRLRRSTSSVGAASRSFISGISECPPASSLASSPPSRSAASASSSELGRDVVELSGDHAGPPFASWMASQIRIGLSGMLM